MDCPKCGEELVEKVGTDFNMITRETVPQRFWHCAKCGFRSDRANL